IMEDDSKGKYFDRQFVASNSKTLFLCPQCSNTYSYSKNQSGEYSIQKSLLPFLLPCGHNLCEKCIWKEMHNLHDLKCAVCHDPAPPMLKTKNPATKSGVSVRDFYDFNYDLVGKIVIRQDTAMDMDSANNSLNDSGGPSEIVQIRKCSECGLKTAPGECSKCDAFYCNRCFDMVHKHSRVLKSHVFQKFRYETPGFRCTGMRIGDEFFPEPGNEKCKHHNLIRNIRCLSCRMSFCQECPIQQHKDHNMKTLTDLNVQLINLHGYHPVLTTSGIFLHLFFFFLNSQTVRATKNEQSGYASKATIIVSNHFCHLRGRLQVAELQAIEKLRESSLPLQMELNGATSKLKSYKILTLVSIQIMLGSLNIKHFLVFFLQNYKQILVSGLETQSRVPENVVMEDLMKNLYEALEKFPSSVEILKNKGTSYRIIPKSIDFTNTLKCTFVNPNIRVDFKTDLHRSHRLPIGMGDKSFSQSSVSEKENLRHFFKPSYHNPGSSQRSMTPQNRWGKTSRGYQSSPASVSQSNDYYIVNTLSALDIANQKMAASSTRNSQDFFNKGSSTSSARNDDWLKPGTLVKLLFIKSPEDFYLQAVQVAHKVRDELDRYAQGLDDNSSSAPSVIEMDQRYITYHQDKDCFFRSKVIMKLAGKDTYKVYLPDMGFELEVHNSNFHNLPQSLAHIPYAAARCRLKDLAPIDGVSKWDSGATDFLKLVAQNGVKLHETRSLSSDRYEVDLLVKNNNTDISVRESFLYAGLARSRTGQESGTGRLAPRRLQLPKIRLEYGDMFMIQMQHVEHPQEFYISHHNLEPHRFRPNINLYEFLHHMNNIQPENIFLGRVHLACAVQLNGIWRRARIEEILSAGYVMIRLVDEGHSQKVYWDQLFVLPKNFWDPETAIRCRLADVETRPETDYVWTPEATNYFKQLTSNPKLFLDVLYKNGDQAYVALTYTRTVGGESTTMSVGVQMVAKGHCTSTGESSKAVRPSNVARTPGLDADTRKFMEQQKVKAVELTPFQRPEEKERNRRIVVNVLHVRKPDEFYITLPHFQPAIEELQKTVQAAAEAMYRDQVPRTNWQIGDMCYVRVVAQSDLDLLWHRGLITKVYAPEGESQLARYEVQLRDLGELVENVSSTCLANIDEGNMRISNSAKRCHLYGIRPPGNGWSDNAIEFFKDQVRAYNHILHVTGHGHSENSLNVVLWGSHTEIPGPFSPARTTFVNINKTLVSAGLAQEDRDPDGSMQDIASIDPSAASADTSDIKAMQTLMDKIDKKIVVNKPKSVDSPRLYGGFQHNEEMPPMELLQDLGKSKPTTGQKVPPVAWTTPRPCKKTIFTGIASNVSYEGNIFVSLANDKKFLEHMRGLLVKEYQGMMKKQEERSTSFSYEVGQPVLVTYHMDNLLYRGIVQRQNDTDEYTVYYVDYGNMEKVTAFEMLPYAPFPQLHAMCWQVSVHGVKPKKVKYSIKEMDTMHQQVVMKLSSIRVIERSDGESKKIPSCQIKVNNKDLATFMIECGMAVSVDTDASSPNSIYIPSKKALEDFKVFEELDKLDDIIDAGIVEKGTRAQRKNETVSTAQPPPAKKKYVVNKREVDRFESDQDFDCQEAALEMYNINIPNRRMKNFNPESNSDSDEDEDEDSTSSDEEEDVDVVVEEEITYLSDSQIKPTNVQFVDGVAKQLKRRIELHQEDMSQQACFSPMDTSTVRSLYQAGSSFKTHHLPTGVKHFMCTVDNVLSATELQISPRLSEFTKHEINLVHETSALISMADPLIPMLGDLCLARYSKDKKWYRGTIEEVQPGTNHATVFYIDFHDTESVPYSHLKVMPEQLRMFPLRSFRVKLHNIKRNRNFNKKSVVQALKACLCKHTDLFARVHYPKNYHANRSDLSDEGYDLIEVDLFESKQKKNLVYQSLIDSWMFMKKT
ncbi:hypothetical protein KR074_004956, partial [Drosophila pseudoananassae]